MESNTTENKQERQERGGKKPSCVIPSLDLQKLALDT